MARLDMPRALSVVGSETEQVVVKLRSTVSVRESFRDLAMAAAVAPPDINRPFDALLFSQRGLVEIEPLFPDDRVRTTFGDRLLLSVASDREDDALSSMNVLSFETPNDARSAVEELRNDDRVEYAHVIPPRFLFGARAQTKTKKKSPERRPPRRRAGASGPLDPLKNRQWGLNAVELAAAQRVTGFKEARNVRIAVIDSGVDSDHPDLARVIAEELNFTTGVLEDTRGHGTHVAGIIGAVRNNRIGITGVCQSRNILSLKALGPYNGPGYYRAIRHAMAQRVKVINLSLGGPFDRTEETLIRAAVNAGIVVVAAMGNDFASGNPTSFPAAIPGVIAVGATTEVDTRAPFSQTGPHIHLCAPGDNILSTVPTYPSGLTSVTNYDAWPGTSMATPFVAATVALMFAKKPAATVAQIRRALERGTDRIAGQTGFTEELGHGRLNVRKSLAAI